MFFLVSLNFDIDKMSLIRCSIDCYCENNASRIEKNHQSTEYAEIWQGFARSEVNVKEDLSSS